MENWVWYLIVGVPIFLFLIYAQKKRWVDFRGRGTFGNLTAFHDFQPKSKQEGIEYVMEERAGKKMEEQGNENNEDR